VKLPSLFGWMAKVLEREAEKARREEEQRRGTFDCACGYRLIWRRVVEMRATHCLCGRELPLVIKGGKAA
jgi:hypothetical protein